MSEKPDRAITIGQPFLPPLEEFTAYLQEIWGSHVLTNGGRMHRELEANLEKYFEVPSVSLFNNGTIGLITGLQVLGLSGEVITTPYSFAATAHALAWNRLTPVFVDIDPNTFNIDPEAIERAVTPKSSAILAVHCYGRPCAVRSIGALGSRLGLRVAYDAAHAFGVKLDGESVLRYGDISVLSFHATKVFNTFEGGAIVSHSADTKAKIGRLRNFGIVDDGSVEAVGINGKMSEVQAAFGLLQLRYVKEALARRRKIEDLYRELLRGVEGIAIPEPARGVESNGSYFPILVQPEFRWSRDELHRRLRERNVISRRYFYPLLSEMAPYKDLPSAARDNLPNAVRIAEQILCLPIHSDLSDDDVELVSSIIRG